MKKLFCAALAAVLSLAAAGLCSAATIINVPIDSRPISDEYLGQLAAIGGDSYIAVSKENLDIFPADSSKNRLGNSAAVRQEVRELAAANNNEDTSVIISTTGYITNGLVGSRCGKNYADYRTALEELKQTAQESSLPKYYVYVPMPRSLPETRLNTIWYDDNKAKGLASYYLRYYPEAEENLASYKEVTPSQLLMEYGYTANKAQERGYKALKPWEKDFLDEFNNIYAQNKDYAPYIEDYKLPFAATADIFATLLEYKNEGIIDEIIVGNDDLQLPDSIKAMYRLGEEIDTENGSPVKYSFSRTYMRKIENTLQKSEKQAKAYLAALGRHNSVNIIRGADELPQLIYARDYTKRHNLTPKYSINYNTVGGRVDEFDVITPQDIARAATNFASGNVGRYTIKPFDLYIFDYADFISYYQGSFTSAMRSSIKEGSNVGLIELYDFSHPTNLIYRDMLSTGSAINIKNISAYSAWNTNANAIGLGVAQAQVWAVAQERCENAEQSVRAQIEALAQHCFEDGEYTAHGKLTLVNSAYKPVEGDERQSEALRATLNENEVIAAFLGGKYTVNGKQFTLKELTLEQASLPWLRTFDCFIRMDAEVEEK